MKMTYTWRELYDMGMAFERAVRKDLEGRGYFVVRSAGSRGPADLVAMRKGIVLLVQCKLAGKLKMREYIRLIRVAEMTSCAIVLATKNKKSKKITYKD